MSLFLYDKKSAIRETKEILKKYHRLKLQHKNLTPSIQSPAITDMPRGGISNNDLKERLADLGREVSAIDKAVEKLQEYDPVFYSIIYYRYIVTNGKMSRKHYEDKIGYENSRYNDYLMNALSAFAETYKGGIIATKYSREKS